VGAGSDHDFQLRRPHARGLRVIFESRPALRQGLLEAVEAIRNLGQGRYACVLDAGGIVLESPEPADGRSFALRQLIEERRASIFSIPQTLADEAPMEDAFAEWREDEFLLAFLNQRVALVVACPDAEGLKERAAPLWPVWADRVLRYDERYRIDPRGRGLLFGSPRLDVVVIGAAG
jgi:hypothetical protein